MLTHFIQQTQYLQLNHVSTNYPKQSNLILVDFGLKVFYWWSYPMDHHSITFWGPLVFFRTIFPSEENFPVTPYHSCHCRCVNHFRWGTANIQLTIKWNECISIDMNRLWLKTVWIKILTTELYDAISNSCFPFIQRLFTWKKYTTLTESTTSCHQQYLICKMLWKVTNNGPTHTVVGALIFACNFEIRLKPISNWVRKLTQTSNFGWIVECFGAKSHLSK